MRGCCDRRCLKGLQFFWCPTCCLTAGWDSPDHRISGGWVRISGFSDILIRKDFFENFSERFSKTFRVFFENFSGFFRKDFLDILFRKLFGYCDPKRFFGKEYARRILDKNARRKSVLDKDVRRDERERFFLQDGIFSSTVEERMILDSGHRSG